MEDQNDFCFLNFTIPEAQLELIRKSDMIHRHVEEGKPAGRNPADVS